MIPNPHFLPASFTSTPSTEGSSGLCRLLLEHRRDLLDPTHAEIPACLFLAIDDIEDALTRERTRTLFGDFVAALRNAYRGVDPADAAARLDRVMAYLASKDNAGPRMALSVSTRAA